MQIGRGTFWAKRKIGIASDKELAKNTTPYFYVRAYAVVAHHPTVELCLYVSVREMQFSESISRLRVPRTYVHQMLKPTAKLCRISAICTTPS